MSPEPIWVVILMVPAKSGEVAEVLTREIGQIIAHGGRLFDPNLSSNATLLTKL